MGETPTVIDDRLRIRFERLGVVLQPDGAPEEADGVLNPGIARDRAGTLLMYPRSVAAGNISRIGLAHGVETADGVSFVRERYVLEPDAPYEVRAESGGYGCEDARVTFVPMLDRYLMAYCAFGPAGPRIAIALSEDGRHWARLGLARFSDPALNALDNKDAAFFPEPVYSPSGIRCFAMYHRPMLPFSVNGQAPIAMILEVDPPDREAMWIGYMPVDAVLADITRLTYASENTKVMTVGSRWGRLKNGAGTPPVRMADGWMSMYHAVDAIGSPPHLSRAYSAGVVLHDLERPHRILYRSPIPLVEPETREERFGTVDDVVFPSGIDPRGDGVFDIYYGAGDHKILRGRLTFDGAR